MSTSLKSALLQWAAAAVALGAIVWLYASVLHVNPTTVALTMLLLVLILARWGLRLAIAVSIAATGLYNFFFLPPIHTFTISDPQNWLALMAFLATAIIGSRLSEAARREARQAKAKQRELEMLNRLNRELMQMEPAQPFGVTATYATQQVLGIPVAMMIGPDFFESPANSFKEQEIAAIRIMDSSAEFSSVQTFLSNTLIRILYSGVRQQGLLLLRELPLSEQTLDAIAGAISLAMERANVTEEVTQRRAAETSERLRTVLLDSITHELRTPLTGIKAAASTLLFAPPAEEEDRLELLAIIDEESDRLNRMVSDITDMAQLSASDVQMHPAKTSTQELIQDALDASAPILNAVPVRIDIEDHARVVICDRIFLRKVLSHLLENAQKYGGPFVEISIRASRDTNGVSISVTDNGPGIPPIEQERIFERFYRGNAEVARVYGTGMGLAISRAILQAHRGTLTVVSPSGNAGATFTAFLPQ